MREGESEEGEKGREREKEKQKRMRRGRIGNAKEELIETKYTFDCLKRSLF